MDRRECGGDQACVTRIEGVDIVREESERQRKQDEEDDPRQPSEQERIEHEMTLLPFRSRCKHCIKGRAREEDCANQVRKRDMSRRSMWTACSWAHFGWQATWSKGNRLEN